MDRRGYVMLNSKSGKRCKEIGMEVPMKKKASEYPLFSVRVTKDTDQKKRKLRELGVDVPALVKPVIDQALSQALAQVQKNRTG